MRPRCFLLSCAPRRDYRPIRSRRPHVRAHDPAVATRPRRTGPATPGACLAHQSIRPRRHTESVIDRARSGLAKQPGGASGDRRRPAVCPYAASAHQSRRPHVRAHDLAVATGLAEGPATPGCVPGPPTWRGGHAASLVRRPGTHRAGEAACAGASGDRRRPAVCPYAASAHRSRRPRVRAHDPAVATRPRRTGRQRRGACPAHQSVRPRRPTASLFVAGPPCARTRCLQIAPPRGRWVSLFVRWAWFGPARRKCAGASGDLRSAAEGTAADRVQGLFTHGAARRGSRRPHPPPGPPAASAPRRGSSSSGRDHRGGCRARCG